MNLFEIHRRFKGHSLNELRVSFKFYIIHFKPSNSKLRLCSNFSKSHFKFESQTYGVASSAKLQISISFNAKNIYHYCKY